MNLCSTLANQDIAGLDPLAVEALYAAILRIRVANIPGTTPPFLCAIGLALNAVDAQLRVSLPMTGFDSIALLRLIFEDGNLIAFFLR